MTRYRCRWRKRDVWRLNILLFFSWQRYHAANHTSATELAQIAKRARPGLLVTYHQLFWGATDEELVEEVSRHYAGTVISVRDLEIY